MRELDEHLAPFAASVAATDVFLSYSRADTAAAMRLRDRLSDAGLATFLDRYQLPAGQEWQPALERGIAGSGAVAILVGPTGLGTWQQREMQLALDRAAEFDRQGRTFPVIPVIMPGAVDPPGGFLKLLTWVDLRSDENDPGQLDLLLKGIRGQPVAGASLREAICPYRGLLAFREEDAGLFFGREVEVAELVEKVRQERLLTLIGSSGSGKSSVIQAGLIPALRRGADGRRWAVVTLRPGDAPLHALVRTFDPPPADPAPLEATARIDRQADILRKDVQAIARLARSLLATQEEHGTERLLVYIDQWEELYTHAFHRAGDAAQAKSDVDRFIELLLYATRHAAVTVVLSLRADFYSDLLRHEELAAAVPPGLVNLGSLSRADLTRIIGEPAAAVGLAVDAALTDTLLDAVADETGKLPLLEYALKETWARRRDQRLTMDAYGEAGGIDGAVALRADYLYAGLNHEGQAAARRLFVSLVTPGEGRQDARARIALPDDPATAEVVRVFSGSDARLLVTGDYLLQATDRPDVPRMVEISHETLIREWALLRSWVDANRLTLRRVMRIRDRMHEWVEYQRDASLLLSVGLPLEEGRRLLLDHGDVIIDDVRPYIEASISVASAPRLSPGPLGNIIGRLIGIVPGERHDRISDELDEQLAKLNFNVRSKESELSDLLRRHDQIQSEIQKISTEIANRASARNQPRVFISYAKEDFSIAKKIAAKLEEAGCAVWFDKKSLIPGQDWRKEIEREIPKSHFLILLCSNNGLRRREFYHAEQRLALETQAQIPEDQLYLIPVRLDGCEMPSEISRHHYLDWYNNEQNEQQLLKAIALGMVKMRNSPHE